MRARRSLVLAACALLAAMPAGAALRSATNGFLTVEVQDAGADVGMFSIRTGSSHPRPELSVLYAVGTSYVTLRDNTAQEIWTNAGTIVNTDIAPYVFRSMQDAPAVASIENLPNGFRVAYALPNWIVQHEFVVSGAGLSATRVRHSITVTNMSPVPRSYGVRNLWDWDLGGIDALHFRTLQPVGAFTQTFLALTSPAFEAFEQVDDVAMPTFRAFGTVRDGPLGATPPDRFGYVAWQDLFEAPWETPIIGDELDSATVHYWGFVTPLTLAAGASATFTQYASTAASAIGIAPDVASEVPTLSQSATAMLALMLLGLASSKLTRNRR
jgi:hypothetical protein